MIGRGTRLCENLSGPGQDKDCFRVFDDCGSLGFFGQNPEMKAPAAGKSLSERLFAARLDFLREPPPPIRSSSSVSSSII